MRELSAIRTTRAEIDLTAICANARALAAIAGTRLCAVIKADAYGHGAREVALALQDAGDVAGFAVSLVEEGVELRDAGVELPVLVMGPALAGGYRELAAFNLTAMISDPADLSSLHRTAARLGVRTAAHLKLDTGMGRLGISSERLGDVVDQLKHYENIRITGLASHLARAEDDDPRDPESATSAQLVRFREAVARARAAGLVPDLLHIANSAATIRFPDARLDMVRCGIALFGNGVQPADGQPALAQVMRLVTHVAQLREIAAGQPVSYGGLWRAERRSRLAVLPVGYADGLPRRATGATHVLIHGRRCAIVGAISMDISIADVTDLGDAIAVGDEAVLLGAQTTATEPTSSAPRASADARDARITAAEFASAAGLIEYEVTCGVSRRVPRTYVSRGEVAA